MQKPPIAEGLRPALVCLTCLLASGVLQAHAADPAEPRFDIRRYAVAGNSVLPAAEVEALLAAYAGSGRQLDDIESARQALTGLYARHGYTTVLVELPEQDISDGTVRLQVRELQVGQVRVLAARHHGDGNVRHSLPGLVEGQVPNTIELAESLRLANENPSKRTQFLFKPTDDAARIDALLRIEDESPVKTYVTLDDSGTAATGRSRLGIGYQHANLFDRDHVLTLQAIGSPEKADAVAILGAGYRLPLYRSADSLDFYAGYSDVSSGSLPGVANVSGKGAILGGHYTYNLAKTSAFEHRLTAGLDYRAYQNDIDSNGTQLGHDVTVHPVVLGYAGQWQGRTAEVGWSVSYSHNLPGGAKGTDSDFQAARTGADANYQLLRLNAHYSQSFAKDWQVRLGLDAQYTDQPLVSGEQFGLGGRDSVRGFSERAVNRDRGLRLGVEVFTPDYGGSLPIDGANLRLSAFLEGGRGLDAAPAMNPAETIGSAGLGLRLGWQKALSLRIDYGRVINGDGERDQGDGRFHASLAYTF
jgi:hemolysin activation/secretion protein